MREWIYSHKLKALPGTDAAGVVTIEGFANYNAPDSVQERLDPMSVDLTRFNKNPILLFNHNMDYPCGRVVAIEKRPEGLYVKAQLSKSDNPQIQFVRDLTAEGILQTFSVRFDKETWESDPDNPGVKVAKNWELQELSIVTIPMQMDSTFNLSTAKSLFNGVTSLTEARGKVMKVKGKLVAALLNGRLAELEKQDGFDKNDFVRAFAVAASVDEPTLSDILAGKITPVPDGVIKAGTEQMGIEANDLSEANAKDVEAQKKGIDQEEQKDKPQSKPAVLPPHAKPADSAAPAAPAKPEDNPADAAAPEQPELTPEQQQHAALRSKIDEYMKSGMAPDEAVQKAIEACSQSKEAAVNYSDDQMKELLMYADSSAARAKGFKDAPSTAIQGNAPGDQQNPMLQMMQQQIALLGQVVGEIQQMKGVISDFVSKWELAEQEDEAEEAQEEAEENGANAEKEMGLQMKALELEAELLQAKLKSMLNSAE